MHQAYAIHQVCTAWAHWLLQQKRSTAAGEILRGYSILNVRKLYSRSTFSSLLPQLFCFCFQECREVFALPFFSILNSHFLICLWWATKKFHFKTGTSDSPGTQQGTSKTFSSAQLKKKNQKTRCQRKASESLPQILFRHKGISSRLLEPQMVTWEAKSLHLQVTFCQKDNSDHHSEVQLRNDGFIPGTFHLSFLKGKKKASCVPFGCKSSKEPKFTCGKICSYILKRCPSPSLCLADLCPSPACCWRPNCGWTTSRALLPVLIFRLGIVLIRASSRNPSKERPCFVK